MNKIFKLILFAFFIGGILPAHGKGPKYIFYFIGDGMGFSHVEATQLYLEATQSARNLLFLDFPVTSHATTYSADSRITDSAAAATALATGIKTSNGTSGMDSARTHALTAISRQLQNEGRQIGIITTVSIDHATPAGFYASQPDRELYYAIGKQAAESGFDFFGGSSLLQPRNNSNPEDTDLYTYFRQNGYTVCAGPEDYRKAASTGKMVLLYDTVGTRHTPYEIDRKPEELSLKDLTEACINRFMQNPKQGFFMMIEGGTIDFAGHSNDAATAIKETIGLDDAVRVAYDFYLKHPKETLIIVTADHETGGMGLGIHDKSLPVGILQHQKASEENLSNILKNAPATTWDDMKTVLKEQLGLWEYIPVSYSEEANLMRIFESTFIARNSQDVTSLYNTVNALTNAVVTLVNQKARIGWTSGNHTGVVVPVYAIGAGQEQFSGRLDNTDIPNNIRKLTGIK
ncbi:MAG: alkaline phosphatase [Coprobacter sp.]|nr:alkaline phosphatase [Coprobacter sp.]